MDFRLSGGLGEKMADFGAVFAIFRPFLPDFLGEAMSHFSAIFARFRAEGVKAICSRSTGS